MKLILKLKIQSFVNGNGLDLDNITDLVVDFKLHVYKDVKQKVKKILN